MKMQKRDEKMLSSKSSQASKQSQKYQTIFDACCDNAYEEVSWFLRQETDVDERNEQGLTCLHLCASRGLLETARVLTSHGANLTLKDQENGWTALHRSVYFGHARLSLFLIKAGSKLDVEYFGEYVNEAFIESVKDKEGFSPLDLLSLQLRDNLSLARKEIEAGSILCFGKSDFTLGVPLPKSADVTRPKRIESLLHESVTHISASKYHSLAITKEGNVYSWGHGRSGRLGHGDEHSQPEPKLIQSLLKVKIIRIAGAEGHTLALSDRGDVFSWGSNTFGQLGHGNSEQSSKILSYPKKVEVLKKDFVVGIAAGESHSLCFTDTGEVYAWGSNKFGQLGIRPSETSSGPGGVHGTATPRKVTMPFVTSAAKTRYVGEGAEMTVFQVVASHQSSMLLCHCRHSTDAIKTKLWKYSEVYQWGDGAHYPRKIHFSQRAGQRRAQSFDQDGSVINDFNNFNSKDPNIITQIAAGRYHFAAISSSGLVYTWGAGSDQLGHGLDESQLSYPQVVEALLPEKGGGRVVFISASENRTCVVTDVGDLYTWGSTEDKGVLAPGQRIYQPVPKKIYGVKRAIKVATGADHTLVLLSPSLPSLADDSSDELVDTAEWRQDVQEVTRPLLPSLQELCQRELLKSVNLRNVLDGLSFAEQFHAKTLASYCLEYIQGNFDAILVQTNPSKIEKYIDDWYWPMQLHSMSKVACRKWEVDAKAILPPNANIPTFESKSLKDVQSSEELLKMIRTTKKKIAAVEEIESKIKFESFVPSLEQKNKLTKKVWMQEELAKMEQMLVRLKVRESHQPIAKDTSSKSKLTPEKEQRTIKSNDSSQLSHEKDFKETFQEVPKENPIIVDHIKDDGIEKSPKVSSQKRSKSSSKSDALSESVVPVQSRSPWLTTHSASMVKDQAADNGKSISAMGENGRTVLSPPSTCPSTPTATPKTANAFSNKKPQPVSTTSEPEDSRKVVVNLFDLITQKKGKEAPKQVNTPIAAAAAWSGNSKPLVSQIVTPTTAPMISKSNKQSLADIQAQEEEERRNSRMTNLKGNDIPWHIERKPRAISFDRVIVEQVSQQHEDVELEEALRMIAEMEAREAADAQRSQKQRKQGQQHHNKQPRHSTQSQNKSKPKASN